MRPLSQLSKTGQQSRDKLNIQIFQFQYAVTPGGRRRKYLGRYLKNICMMLFMILIGIVGHVSLVSELHCREQTTDQ